MGILNLFMKAKEITFANFVQSDLQQSKIYKIILQNLMMLKMTFQLLILMLILMKILKKSKRKRNPNSENVKYVKLINSTQKLTIEFIWVMYMIYGNLDLNQKISFVNFVVWVIPLNYG